jgi:hypothetical protein
MLSTKSVRIQVNSEWSCNPKVPCACAGVSTNYKTTPSKRDQNILFIEQHGKYRWQNESGYRYRALVETAMFRYKTIIGERVYSRSLSRQKIEAKIACQILNTMASLGMPVSTKIKNVA